MNFRLTLILAVVLLLCSTSYLWISSRPKVEKKVATASTIYPQKPAEIKAISFTRFGTEDLKFVKQGDQWKMLPDNVNADNSKIDSLASALQNLAFREKFEPEPSGNRSADTTGTAKPHYTVKFSDTAGKEYTVSFGKHSTDSIFATVNADKTIYVLESSPLDLLDQSPDKFRNSQIKQLDSSKIAKISLQSRDQNWSLEKSGDKWLVSAPVSARANGTTADEITRELGNIRADTFSNLTKKEAGLDPPLISVTAYLAPATPPTTGPATAPATTPPAVLLELGYPTDLSLDKKTSPVYASVAGSNEVFVFSNESLKKLNRTLKDVRDAAVTAAPVTNATAMTLSTDGAISVSLSKTNDKWSLSAGATTGSTTMDADPSDVSNYFGGISTLRAINFVDNAGDLKSIGLDPPHMKIDLTLPGQTQHEVLLVGKPETAEGAEKVTPVMRQGEPTVYLLQTAEADKLATSDIKLRDKEIQDLNSDRVRSIAIAGPAATPGIAATRPATTGPATAPAAALTPGVTLERDGAHWVVTAGTPGSNTPVPADDSKISSLLADFTPLETNKYLDDKADTTGTPALTVTITTIEPTLNLPPGATQPAAGPTSSPVAATAPATKPAMDMTLAPVIAPDPGKTVTHTLRLYRVEAPPTTAPAAPGTPPAPATWKAVWDGQTPTWTFEPMNALVDHLTKETYNVSPATPKPATPTPTIPKSPF